MVRVIDRARRSRPVALAALALLAGFPAAQDAPAPRTNVLWITVDDMNRDSVGAFGCALDGTTPAIDALAAAGMRFERAHVTIAICQPTRAVWMTGRYPHRNGALGFDPIDPGVPTLVEAVHAAGYHTVLLGKVPHVVPTRHAAFDTIVPAAHLRSGRSPERYAEELRAAIARAAAAGKPFFVMANAHDPHRPFATSDQEANHNRRARERGEEPPFPPAERAYEPGEVPVPAFLPDLPAIRLELAEYFTSVRRADRTVGALLDALADAGAADRTLVVFLSDHGMPLPFAKTNCYPASTSTPLVVRWPAVTAAGAVDRDHFVGGVDLAPTLLDALGLPPLPGADGRSFVPLLRGEAQDGRDAVFTMINTTFARREFAMRAVHTATHCYVWNAWADGETTFRNESQAGRSFAAMQRAAATDPAIAARVELFLHRVPEELFTAGDTAALRNLAGDGAHGAALDAMRIRLRELMAATADPLLARFDGATAR